MPEIKPEGTATSLELNISTEIGKVSLRQIFPMRNMGRLCAKSLEEEYYYIQLKGESPRFFHQSIPRGSLIKRSRYFRMRLQIRKVILTYV
jgi:hypothetical protein